MHLVPAVAGRQDDVSHVAPRAKGFPYPLQHNRFDVILVIPPADGHKHASVSRTRNGTNYLADDTHVGPLTSRRAP
eukprot:1192489-Prorocentrum_minimum.AAC.2